MELSNCLCMFRNPQKYLWSKTSCADRLHCCGNIISSSVQSHRSIGLTACLHKIANINSRNYYELLGVEKTATQKEIKQAFFKLSKEYHPDSNSTDKSLHNKFVKINEAFSVLSKPSSRTTYDQSLTSISRYPQRSHAYERRPSASSAHWTSPNYDQAFYDAFRKRMESDRQRFTSHSHYYASPNSSQENYFGAASIILIIIGFGMFIHALQWRMMQFSDPQYAIDPRTRHYRAYREWQRMSAVKDAELDGSTSSSSAIDDDGGDDE